MDFHLKQWRNQQYESEQLHQNHPAKIPKLLIGNTNSPHDTTQYQKPELSSVSALPLFVPDQHQPNNPTKLNITNLSPPPPPTTLPSSRLPRMGSSYFSLAQWQELELQALIFRYMLAGATVPTELLNPIKKSLCTVLNTPHQYFLHQYYPHYHHHQSPAWYWGRAAMDPEPGRCRRTDGKKWRCSRDVVVGQKYCERHMHRGRHRSRKPVETPTKLGGGTHFALSGKMSSTSLNSASNTSSATTNTSTIGGTSIDHLCLGRSSSDHVKRENKQFSEPNNIDVSCEAKSDGHVLRHFFDDWPRSRQESDNVVTACNNTTSSRSSATSLSISMPGNLSSDVSLKLATGNGDEAGCVDRQSGWVTGWSSSAMGGPLAEALRSSNSDSPTSVLHQLPRGSASETCIVSS